MNFQNMNMNLQNLSIASAARRWFVCIGFGLALTGASLAATDIANAPLFTSSVDTVKPNIMFILDDSGSMKDDYLPDEAAFPSSFDKYGRKAWQCNGLAFNPNVIYKVPVDAAGTPLAAAPLTLASGIYYRYSGLESPLSFTYLSSGVVTTTTFYKECNSTVGQLPGSAVFTAVNVTSASPEAQNYANWSKYYKTRIDMMKTSISLAFKGIDNRYRVGFSTISEKTVVEGSKFLNIRDFDTTQKQKFYTTFNNLPNPNGFTPLRGALSKAGQYYAKKIPGQTLDPIQYSCQRNFTILSTDGYWNTPDETPQYGPLKLDNSTHVGQQDGSGTLLPMRDGVTASGTGGSSDSLADVAMYYYQTDLRDSSLGNCTGALGGDVCENNVKGSTSDARHSYGDSAKWQHMTTFTLGLGANGVLKYDRNYLNQTSGDFFDITNGAKKWPTPGPGPSGTGAIENIDDLWHAAVDGRGQYFSASDPTTLSASLNSALDTIKALTGSAAAASTSSLQPVVGDNDIYLAKFTSLTWVGDIEAYTINPVTGAISTTTTWKASEQLDALGEGGRTIYYPSPSGSSALRPFTYANLLADGYDNFFTNFCGKPSASGASAPGQCSSLSAADRADANSGAKLVSYLRGNQSLSYYRSREHLLGDIINASPLFIGNPSFKYTDAGYSAFKATTRTAVVLAAANDGMLHAFDRLTGVERWAYVPSFVMGNMYKLADTNYPANHSFLIDGSPQLGDVFDPRPSGGWRTIVVGGLNAGGRGYYALDVTNPIAPKLLWEFTHDNLGLTFGNPIITKRTDGTWIVVFTSGYNNVSPGDGNGHLFILDALTGRQITSPATPLTIDTFTSGTIPAGTTAAPSGLAKLNAWVDNEQNNTARRFYSGDLLGNLWRFDIDNLVAPHQQALRLAQLKANGVPQSITTKPALGEVLYNHTAYPVVYVATGRYLGTTDLSNKDKQTVYAIKDPMTDSPYGDIHALTSMVTQTITAASTSATATRTVTTSPVNWATGAGWFADFPIGGERVNINPQLTLNTLYVGTNIPSSDTCTIGGSSLLYRFDITTGAVAPSDITYVGDVLIQGIDNSQLSSAIDTILTRSDGSLQADPRPIPPTPSQLRRTSWRELVD